MKTFMIFEQIENFANREQYTKEELKDFAKYCVEMVSNMSKVEVRESAWVIQNIDDESIFEQYENDGGFNGEDEDIIEDEEE